ncbi:conserved hypothetical protein [Methylocella tundrae]|uniref:TIR domain-containing protein n=1 Tax=Methylocella tundrae TaxID=227605 RepID=A0A8B6M8G5_METTU|nr:toll/interleukin-1 receptor domain-containing protein [Methylocella tundrae]VTZ51170.1 conserved hypothetical protein [Methylocella tundrae]
MQYPVVITLIHHPKDTTSTRTAQAFVAHFDKIGMQRAGVQMRIPVRVRSEPLGADGSLAPIRALGANLNVVVMLYGVDIEEKPTHWLDLCRDAERSVAPLFGIVTTIDSGLGSLGCFDRGQTIAWWDWQGLDDEARATRLLIHVVNAIRRQLFKKQAGEREKIFLSHAKSDGKLAAERIVRHISDPANGLRLDTFYDARELETGEDWREGLEEAASKASMLAIVTDLYDSRPWCNQEILWAKEFRRPLLLVDLGCKRVERTFPYSGNMTVIRSPLADPAGIERALLELLTEALRCDLFAIQAGTVTGGAAEIFPRPPELADLAFLADQAGNAKTTIVYPDPPLPDVETQLLAKLANGRKILALSDYQ